MERRAILPISKRKTRLQSLQNSRKGQATIDRVLVKTRVVKLKRDVIPILHAKKQTKIKIPSRFARMNRPPTKVRRSLSSRLPRLIRMPRSSRLPRLVHLPRSIRSIDLISLSKNPSNWIERFQRSFLMRNPFSMDIASASRHQRGLSFTMRILRGSSSPRFPSLRARRAVELVDRTKHGFDALSFVDVDVGRRFPTLRGRSVASWIGLESTCTRGFRRAQIGSNREARMFLTIFFAKMVKNRD